MSDISVVIPTLNAAAYLPDLLAAIQRQEGVGSVETVLVDSSSDDGTPERAGKSEGVRVVSIARADFTHGRARNLGAREAAGKMLVFLTQDALPQGTDWLAELVAPLADEGVAATYGRQVPYPGADPMETYFLTSHFPPASSTGEAGVERKASGTDLRIEDVFFSNVSAAYRGDLLRRHPFEEDLIMSEDQQIARDLLHAGHRIVYAPRSVVTHSHSYRPGQIFGRYFDSAYSLKCILGHGLGDSARIGRQYLLREIGHICRHHPRWVAAYLPRLAAKVGGALLGGVADRMPRRWARRCSMHKGFWDRPAPPATHPRLTAR